MLTISNESITYYASLVSYYSVYKLKRMKTGPVALYLKAVAKLKKVRRSESFIIIKGQLLTKFVSRYAGGHGTQTVSL